MMDFEIIVRRLRTITGCFLFFYAVTHLLNHSLGLISLEVMELGRSIFLKFWRNQIIFYALYGALFIHFILGIYAIGRRRSFLLTRKEWIRNITAALIPFFLASHLSITLFGSRFLGLNDSYAFMILSTYLFDPVGYIGLSVMLILIWTHGSIGLIGLLEFRGIYLKYKLLLNSLIFGLPILALGGYFSACLELMLVKETQPHNILEILARSNFNEDVGQAIVWLSDVSQFIIYPSLVLSIIFFFLFRGLIEKKFNSIEVRYADGKISNVKKGTSLLEASHKAGLYHESVCGGRGRCTTCRVRVSSSLNALPQPNQIEQKVIERLNFDTSIRLACQLRPKENIEINPLINLVESEKNNLLFSNQKSLSGMETETVILFCDLRGFTKLSDNKLPFDVVFILNKYFKLVSEAVESNQGRIDKFIGDGVMAIFDKSNTLSASCRNALKAAAEISSGLDRLNDELYAEAIDTLRVGIGIHTGTAILGKMGYGTASNETAIGDTVNVASRLEQLTKRYSCELIFSNAVALSAGLDLQKLDSIKTEIRGKKDFLEAFYCKHAPSALNAF